MLYLCHYRRAGAYRVGQTRWPHFLFQLLLEVSAVTRSISAVAESLRDALCPSVVSFNSTTPQAQSFIISHFGFRFTTAYN